MYVHAIVYMQWREFTCVGCRDISNNITICVLVTQHVAMLSEWDDGPIHPSVVRATRPTKQQNRISRSCTEVCSRTSTSLPTRPTLASLHALTVLP